MKYAFKAGSLIRDDDLGTLRKVLFVWNGRYYFIGGSLSKQWVELWYSKV